MAVGIGEEKEGKRTHRLALLAFASASDTTFVRRLLLDALVCTLLPEMVEAAATHRTVQRRRGSNGGRRRGAEVAKKVRHR
jgi:hypothetical protein